MHFMLETFRMVGTTWDGSGRCVYTVKFAAAIRGDRLQSAGGSLPPSLIQAERSV